MHRRLLSSSLLSFSKRVIPFKRMSSTLSHRYLADENSPFSRLEAKPFFESLSQKEKTYAHHMSRASFEGTRIIIAQTNPNAVAIYDMILKTFTSEQGGMVNPDTLFEQR